MKKFVAIVLAMVLAVVATFTNSTSTPAGCGIDAVATAAEVATFVGHTIYKTHQAKKAEKKAVRHVWQHIGHLLMMAFLLPLTPMLGIRPGGRMARKAGNAMLEKADEAAEAKTERKERYEAKAKEQAEFEAEYARIVGVAPRKYTKKTPAKNKNIKVLVLPGEALLAREIEQLKELGKITCKTRDAVTLMRNGVSNLIRRLESRIAEGTPIVADTKLAHWEPAYQCEAMDIAGVCYGEQSDLLVKTEIPLFSYVNLDDKVMSSAFKDAEAVTDRITQLMEDVVTINGFKVGNLYYEAWASSNAMQKVGKTWFGEKTMMKRTAKARHNAVALADLGNGAGTSGADELKLQSLLFTPSSTTDMKISEIAIVDSIEKSQFVKRLIEVSDDGTARMKINQLIVRKLFDGLLVFLDDTPSFQGRGFGLKFLGVNVSSLLDKYYPNWKEITIHCVDGDHKAGEFRAIGTVDIWKGKGLGLKWPEFVSNLTKLAEEFPGIDHLRVVRYADSAGEKVHKTARQMMQQYLNGTDADVAAVTKKTASRLIADKKAENVLVRLAGRTKKPEERTAMETIFSLVPEMIASRQWRQINHETWERDFAEAAGGTVETDADYPYLTQDPKAFLDVVLGHMDPNNPNLGLLKAGEFNGCNLMDLIKCAMVRFPANFMTIMNMINVNRVSEDYASCGNIDIVNVHDVFMDVQDADVDGDEERRDKNLKIIEMTDRIDAMFPDGRPVVTFNHSSSNAKTVVNDERELRKLVSRSLWIAQKFNKTGQYSNMATACLNNAGECQQKGDMKGRNHWLTLAVFCHVATILVIDMCKTGQVPAMLMKKLEQIKGELGKGMPYNQKYAKHTYDMPYWHEAWGDKVWEPTTSFVDRMATHLEKVCGEYTFDVGDMTFDVNVLLATGVKDYPRHGRIPSELESRLGLFNSNKHEPIKSDSNGEYSAKALMVWLWKNACALQYRMQNDNDMNTADVSQQIREVRAFCRDVVVSLYSDRIPAGMTQWQLEKSLINYFILDAFEMRKKADGSPMGNDIGHDVPKDNTWKRAHLKASYCRFVLEVFAEDILDNVETNLGIPTSEKWMYVHAIEPEKESESYEDDLDF